MKLLRIALTVTAAVTGAISSAAAQVEPSAVLTGAEPMTQAVETLQQQLDAEENAETRFALGIAQALVATEHLAQQMYRYGVGSTDAARNVPFLRLPLPPTPEPEAVNWDDLQTALARFAEELAAAEATLAEVEAQDVKLTLDVGEVRLDLNGDGQASEAETLASVWSRIGGNAGGFAAAPAVQEGGGQAADPAAQEGEQQGEKFVLALDAGDVAWLRGYCHLLMAMSDVVAAHDATELMQGTGHLVFPNNESPFPFLEGTPRRPGFSFTTIADAVALIHLINLPVEDPERMQSALEHFRQVPALSRQSWRAILAETDDEREWIPNPQQTPALGESFRIEQEQIDQWLAFLDEADAILEGNKLIPFWREGTEEGVNLNKVFDEPRPFDLVLWVQGTAAAPYLEEGAKTQPEFWNQLNRAFGGNFMTFAAWFN